MKKILDYTILDKIDETYKSIIYRCKKKDEDKTLVIKVLKHANPSLVDIAKYKHEIEILTSINLDGILKAYDIIHHKNTYAIILEDFGGISLKKIIAEKKIDIEILLKYSIEIASILGEIHRQEIIHNDIKPSNILINEKNEEVKIADFGISKILSQENNMIYEPSVIEGTLVYMSPEQTGRMNRAVDYRTDLYSLGITLYEMFTGTVPFKSKDPMELIYSHIAKNPADPHSINSNIPSIISKIIIKLLSKNADERYQNSLGLASDLKKCFIQLKENNSINEFELATEDIPPKFQLPHVLVGREKEIKEIYNSFDRVTKGEKELILVSGPPGIGKSSLIKEVNRPIVAVNGYFLSGKYNQFGNDVPYNGIIQALTSLAKQILIESQGKIDEWKVNLKAVLNQNGKIITDLIRDFRFIIGEQESIPELNSKEAEERFYIVIKKFIHVFAQPDHPLVIFLDDLQWADLASFHLLIQILKDPDLKHILIICSFRDNEINQNHPLVTMLKELGEYDFTISDLALSPLFNTDVNLLVSQILKCDENNSKELSDIIFKKTGGNPFFVNQFIKNLYEIKIIELHPQKGWIWDIQKIKALKMTDNVVELMTKKIRILPEETQELLKISACLGNSFDLKDLSHISKKSFDEIFGDLKSVITEDFFIIKDTTYSFSHDRIQEAAYSIIGEEEKNKIHYKIGKELLRHNDEREIQNNIIYITRQLNFGIDLNLTEIEKKNIMLLNFQAGIQAKAANAYTTAFNYLKTGLKLLGEEPWKNNYSLALQFFIAAAETAYLSSNNKEAHRLTEEVIKNGKSLIDTIKAYEICINTFKSENKLNEAIKTGIIILRKLGIRFPKNPTMAHVLVQFLKTRLTLGKNKDILNKPEIKDPELLATMRILGNIGLAAYWAQPNLVPLLVFKSISISNKKGNSLVSPFHYAAYGFILCTIDKFNEGYQYGKMALELQDKISSQQYKAKTMQVAYNLIMHWKDPLRMINKQHLTQYRVALEIGDIEFAAVALQVYCNNGLFTGENLHKLKDEFSNYIQIMKTMTKGTPLLLSQLYLQILLNLSGKSEKPNQIIGEIYNEKEMEPFHKNAGDQTALCSLYLFRSILEFMFGNYTKAYESIQKAEKELDSISGTYMTSLFPFYQSLIILGKISNETKRKQEALLKIIYKNIKKIKKWSQHAPHNHQHKLYLIEAELARFKNNNSAAMDYYEKAITGANINKFSNEEAIACELAAKFYLELKNKSVGYLYIAKAYGGYLKWGADAKLNQLEELYPDHLDYIQERPDSDFNNEIMDNSKDTSTISGKTLTMLDISTVIAVSQTLSREIELRHLLEAIMKLAVENAGAQKGLLIMENAQDNKLYVEASVYRGEIEVLESIDIADNEDIPLSIINYVYRTGEYVILDNAKNSNMFLQDPYIVRNKTKSVVCAPLIDRGNMISILYLENNLAANVFTAERLELISVFMSQCAISINNARLIVKEKHNAVLENEIKMAKRIQQSLLPKEIPQITQAEIAFKYEPMMEIGGDFVSIKYKSDSNKLGLFICDVSGHGVSAALTASMISMSLDFYWEEYFDEPTRVLNEIRKSLIGKMGGFFFTAAMCSIDLEQGLMTYVSGGHQPVIILRKSGETDIIQQKGRLIHEYIEPNLKDISVNLHDGDRIFLYTDGVTEAENADGDFLGAQEFDTFCSSINRMSKESETPEILCNNIFNEIIQFMGNTDFDDDTTILIAEYKK